MAKKNLRKGGRVWKVVPERAEYDDPPLKEWFRAKLVELDKVDGEYSDGLRFKFRVDQKDPAVDGLNVQHVWGTIWPPLALESAAHRWACEFEGEEVDLDDEIDWDSYVGRVVEVMCDKRGKRKDGGRYIDVIDVRQCRRKKKRTRREETEEEERPRRRKKKRRSPETEERPAKTKKKRKSKPAADDVGDVPW